MTTDAMESATRERLRSEVEALAAEFKGIFARETVEHYLHEAFASFAKTPVASFRPTLAGRFARERLLAAAQARGAVAKKRPKVLFVCVHNAGRSQMAAALTASLGGGRVSVRSAGSAPADRINPAVVEAMKELGLDVGQAFPKPLTDDVVRAADVVITMGCGDSCPVYPGKRYLDWTVDDPAGQPVEAVRRIREDIASRVRALLRELGVA
ncbi:MAG: arsenate reductase ArsC [SAR202 cluster bacterium]|nr:arsenate reductase ArsC [SAR202 cluster bacterium]